MKRIKENEIKKSVEADHLVVKWRNLEFCSKIMETIIEILL